MKLVKSIRHSVVRSPCGRRLCAGPRRGPGRLGSGRGSGAPAAAMKSAKPAAKPRSAKWLEC